MILKQTIFLFATLFCIKGEVRSISDATFPSTIGSTIQQLKTGSFSLPQAWMILFYSPEVDDSLDARQIVHQL